MNIQASAFRLYLAYARATGEKSTSWGNTFITHLFIQMAMARALSNLTKYDFNHWMQVAATQFDLTPIFNKHV